MNSGSFFRLDLETSKVVSGITYYNYIDVPDLHTKGKELRYPIKLSISSDCVSFFVHYYKAEYSPRHVEDIILRLPFYLDTSEELSSTIKRIYNTEFPSTDYLVALLKNRYVNENADYAPFQKSQINKDSYSSLYIWGLLKNQEGDKSSYQIQDDESERITRFLRKLLLDFMFDLMHSDVFESSKYYSQMREGLMKDFFFSSLVKKCEYYYYRRLVRKRFDVVGNDCDYVLAYPKRNKKLERLKNKEKAISHRISDTSNSKCCCLSRLDRHLNSTKHKEQLLLAQAHSSTDDALVSLKKLYAEHLQDAESAWVDTILSPMAEKHFSFSPDWFEDKKPSEKHEDFTVSDSWFVDPEEEMNRIVFPLDNKKTKKKHYLNSYELSKLIGAKDYSSVVDKNTTISKWFYRRFDFKHTFRLHLFNGWNDAFAIVLFAFFAFSVISALFPKIALWEKPMFLASFPLAMSLGCLICSAVFVIKAFFERRSLRNNDSLRIDEILLIKRIRRESFRALRLSVIFLCLGILLFFSDELCLWQVVVIFILFVVTLFIRRSSESGDIIHLLLPRLVASITTAWIMLVIGNDLIKEHVSAPLCVIILVVVFLFILYENNKTLPNTKKRYVIWRSLELMLISFSISLIIGIFAVDILSPSLWPDVQNAISESSGVPYSLHGSVTGIEPANWSLFGGTKYSWSLTIFPAYLIQFSFLAMFIGVFIQMIFEEKNITEL